MIFRGDRAYRSWSPKYRIGIDGLTTDGVSVEAWYRPHASSTRSSIASSRFVTGANKRRTGLGIRAIGGVEPPTAARPPDDDSIATGGV